MQVRFSAFAILIAAFVGIFATAGIGQTNSRFSVIAESDLANIVPSSFYFAGQNGQTQLRNSAAARIGKDRHVIVGLVDTSGYSAEVSGKYEGFFITDSPITLGNRNLSSGAYGFGFTQRGQIRIFELNARQILAVAAAEDRRMERPRPLQMVVVRNGVRLYHGRNYVLITPR